MTSLVRRKSAEPRTEEPPAEGAPSIEQRIEQLQAEAAQITAAEAADPITAAPDLPSWHARDRRRRERQVEIERLVRDLREFGPLTDTHSGPIGTYLAVARPLAAQHAKVIQRRLFTQNSDDGHNADRDVIVWWEALSELARRLPRDSEAARIMLTREAEDWFRFRDAWLIAHAMHMGRRELPSPEIAGLPDWLRWGAHRVDDRATS